MSRTPPFMQLYVGDYLADTLHLTTEQHGAYLLLLMTMWRSGASLPNDPSKLARICRVSPKRWPQIWSEIECFFEIEGETITQLRLSKEHQKAVSISKERKLSGKKGGEANALNYKNTSEANASDLLKHSQISDIRYQNIAAADASAHAPEVEDLTFRERLLVAVGADPISGLTGHGGSTLGTQVDMIEANRWLELPGITEALAEQVVREKRAKMARPPKSFRYFTDSICELSGQLSAPALTPTHSAQNHAPRPNQHDQLAAAVASLEAQGRI